jgi:hypothetical protein
VAVPQHSKRSKEAVRVRPEERCSRSRESLSRTE